MAGRGVLDETALGNLREMTGDDPAFLAEIIDTYVADAGDLLATMRQAFRVGDAPELRRAAHSLKSNSATLGATELAALCQALEEQARSGAMDRAGDLLAQIGAAYVEVEAALRAARPVA